MEDYKSVAKPATASLIEKKSEFIGHIAPVCSEEEALAVLHEVQAKHRTASHNVYAYRLRTENRQRYSDDGEPAKTAGLPVLSVLQGDEVTDVVLVVTRYFGGTLLGTGGLVRAYTHCAKATLEKAGFVYMRLCVPLTLHLPYALYEQLNRVFLQAGAQMKEPVFAENVQIQAVLPAGEEVLLAEQIQELSSGSVQLHVGEPFHTAF